MYISNEILYRNFILIKIFPYKLSGSDALTKEMLEEMVDHEKPQLWLSKEGKHKFVSRKEGRGYVLILGGEGG